ncbi:MAG: triose-phosphate isomerase [Pseudomonadota bacterium]
MKRLKLIAGNWKMHFNRAQAVELVNGIRYGLRFPGEVEVVVAPPLTALSTVAEVLKDSYISVAAQNIHFEEKGAFTGEVSASMIKDAGADYVIIGHSERRQYFGETDQTVNKKLKAAFAQGLIPLFCVGETLSQRENGLLSQIITSQIEEGMRGLSPNEAKDMVIAYEPVWAIGTGKVASSGQIAEVHLFIRQTLIRNWGQEVGESIRLLYGGSVKADNAREILHLPNVDGALVGGASLKAQDFIEIIKNSSNSTG